MSDGSREIAAMECLVEEMQALRTQLAADNAITAESLSKCGMSLNRLLRNLLEVVSNQQRPPDIVHVAVEGHAGTIDGMKGFVSLTTAERYMVDCQRMGHNVVVIRNVPVVSN